MGLVEWLGGIRRGLVAVRRMLFGPHAVPGHDTLGFDDGVWVRMRGAQGYREALSYALTTFGPVSAASLTVDAQPTGKYVGRPRIHAFVPGPDGQGAVEVGVVDARYRSTDQGFFDVVLSGATQGWLVVSTDSRDELFGRLVVAPVPVDGPVDWFTSAAEDMTEPAPLGPADGLPEHTMVRWLPTGRRVPVSGDENVAPVLAEWLGDAESREIVVSLTRQGLDGHRHDRVRVWAFNQEVGWLGATTSARLAALIDQAEADGCVCVATASIVRHPRRPEVVVAVGAPSSRP